MDKLLDQAVKLYELQDCTFTQNADHEDFADAEDCLVQNIPYAGIGCEE